MDRKPTIPEVIKSLAQRNRYFSIEDVKRNLTSHKISFKDSTVKQTLSRLKTKKEIFSAGRGYYSTIEKTVELDHEPVKRIIELVKNKYPFLDFSVWSTKQISFAFHHIPNRFITIFSTDVDAISSLGDFLNDNDFFAYANPSSSEAEKFVTVRNNTIVIRPIITRAKSKDNVPTIEIILVDLFLESERLALIDEAEYTRIWNYFIQNYRLNLSLLLDYAGRRKISDKFKELIDMYTNAT